MTEIVRKNIGIFSMQISYVHADEVITTMREEQQIELCTTAS